MYYGAKGHLKQLRRRVNSLQASVTHLRHRRLWTAAFATAAVTLTAGSAIVGSAPAATFVTRTVNAAHQRTGIGCGETRLAAAVAFQNKGILTLRCLGQVNNSSNKYAIATSATGPTVYISSKFFNGSTHKWRIAVTRRTQ
jgi:hypothetical protein